MEENSDNRETTNTDSTVLEAPTTNDVPSPENREIPTTPRSLLPPDRGILEPPSITSFRDQNLVTAGNMLGQESPFFSAEAFRSGRTPQISLSIVSSGSRQSAEDMYCQHSPFVSRGTPAIGFQTNQDRETPAAATSLLSPRMNTDSRQDYRGMDSNPSQLRYPLTPRLSNSNQPRFGNYIYSPNSSSRMERPLFFTSGDELSRSGYSMDGNGILDFENMRLEGQSHWLHPPKLETSRDSTATTSMTTMNASGNGTTGKTEVTTKQEEETGERKTDEEGPISRCSFYRFRSIDGNDPEEGGEKKKMMMNKKKKMMIMKMKKKKKNGDEEEDEDGNEEVEVEEEDNSLAYKEDNRESRSLYSLVSPQKRRGGGSSSHPMLGRRSFALNPRYSQENDNDNDNDNDNENKEGKVYPYSHGRRGRRSSSSSSSSSYHHHHQRGNTTGYDEDEQDYTGKDNDESYSGYDEQDAMEDQQASYERGVYSRKTRVSSSSSSSSSSSTTTTTTSASMLTRSTSSSRKARSRKRIYLENELEKEDEDYEENGRSFMKEDRDYIEDEDDEREEVERMDRRIEEEEEAEEEGKRNGRGNKRERKREVVSPIKRNRTQSGYSSSSSSSLSSSSFIAGRKSGQFAIGLSKDRSGSLEQGEGLVDSQAKGREGEGTQDSISSGMNTGETLSIPLSPHPCNCTKTRCLKLYCDCFAKGYYCNGCNCVNCHNNAEHQHEREEAIQQRISSNSQAFLPRVSLDGNSNRVNTRGCNCRKTGCLKKYCECYQAGIPCGVNCRCHDCRNTVERLKSGGKKQGK